MHGNVRKCHNKDKKSPSLNCKRKNCPEILHDWVPLLRGGELLRATQGNDILKFHLSGQVGSGNCTSTVPQGLGASDWVHQSCVEGQDQKIPRMVPPLRPSGMVNQFSLSEAMTRRSSVHQQRRSHFSGQAAWYIKLSSRE